MGSQSKRKTILYLKKQLCQQGLEYTDCSPLQKCKNPPQQKIEHSWYDTKLHLMVTIQIWKVWSALSLLLLQDSLWSGVVVPVRIPFMCQIDLFKNNLYLIGIFKAILLYTHMLYHNDTIIKQMQEDFFRKYMYLSLYCKGSKRLFKVCVWEGAGDRT